MKVAGLGAVAGMRSMAAPAMLSAHLVRNQNPPRPHESMLVRLFDSPMSAGVFGLMAAGEVIADKLPILPDRTSPASLVGRAVVGAAVGSVVSERYGERRTAGAALGAAASLASATGSFFLRRAVSRFIPDRLVAAAEDAVVAGTGRWVLAARSVPGERLFSRFTSGYDRGRSPSTAGEPLAASTS